MFLAVFVVGCQSQDVDVIDSMSPEVAEVPKSPIKVGGLAPLSGDASEYGLPARVAQEIAISEINSQGGIDGRMLEILWEDGECDQDVAAVAVKKLIDSDDVRVIFGGICSDETLAAAPITEESVLMRL